MTMAIGVGIKWLSDFPVDFSKATMDEDYQTRQLFILASRDKRTSRDKRDKRIFVLSLRKNEKLYLLKWLDFVNKSL